MFIKKTSQKCLLKDVSNSPILPRKREVKFLNKRKEQKIIIRKQTYFSEASNYENIYWMR